MVTRVTHVPEQFAAQFEAGQQQDTLGSSTPAPVAPMARVHSGAIRLDGSNAGPTEHGAVRYQAQAGAGNPGGSVADTITSTYGRPSVELEPGNPASRTNVETAVRLSILERHEGGYRDVRSDDGQRVTQASLEAASRAEEDQQNQAAAEQLEADNEGVFSAKEDEAWRADLESVPDHAFRATAASVTRAVLLDGDLEGAAKTLSQSTGMESARASEMVENAVWAQQQIVDRAVAKAGITEGNREAFYESLRENPGALQNALQFLLHGRDTSAFQHMARDWLARSERLDSQSATRKAEKGTETDRKATTSAAQVVGINEDALKAAGFDTSTSRSGVLMVRRGPQSKWISAADLLNS